MRPVIAISPASPTTVDALVAHSRVGAPEVDWRWWVDGVHAGSGARIVADQTLKGQEWVLEALIEGSPVARDRIRIGNTPPRGTLRSGPERPVTTDELWVSLDGQDIDEDILVSTVLWTVNGLATDHTGPSVSAEYTARDEVWRATAELTDGEATVAFEAEWEIRTPPPRLIALSLPEEPTVLDEIRVDASSEDVDGDPVVLDTTWSVNGAVVQEGGEVLQTTVKRGDLVEVVAIPSDGSALGAAGAAVTTIVNAAPEVVSVSLDPVSLYTDTAAGAVVGSFDADGDALDVNLAWYVNALLVSDEDTLPADAFRKGDTVRVCATVWDGSTLSSARETETGVLNTAPTAAVTVSPARPVRGIDSVTCEATTDDLDEDDVVVTFTWSTGQTGPVLPAADVPLEAPAVCTASADDGEATATADAAARIQHGGNVLLILADDLGTDKVAAYGEHPEPPHTPVIDGLAHEGLLFRNAYTNPTCSPTRASLLTGRYNQRYGLSRVVRSTDDSYLVFEEYTVPELLVQGRDPYSSGVAGKWHLTGYETVHQLAHPQMQGFDTHRGTAGNIGVSWTGTLSETGYYNHEHFIDGSFTPTSVYATTQTTDDALEILQILEEPWFLYVAFNAPHKPLDVPPEDLHTVELGQDPEQAVLLDAVVETMDTEIGRLLEAVDRARTTVIFMGDNGTERTAVRSPWRGGRAKGTLYEGGINVPMIVTGPWVTPGETDALVQSVDVLPTLADMAFLDVEDLVSVGAALPLDGESFLPVLRDPFAVHREYVPVSQFGPNGAPPWNNQAETIRDARYKLIRAEGEEGFYDLAGVDYEGEDLLAGSMTQQEADAYARLSAELDRWMEETTYAH